VDQEIRVDGDGKSKVETIQRNNPLYTADFKNLEAKFKAQNNLAISWSGLQATA